MSQKRNGRLRNGRLKKRIENGEHLVRDPEIYHGELTFRGTRVPVSVVLAYLAKGISVDEVPQHWPDVSPDAACFENTPPLMKSFAPCLPPLFAVGLIGCMFLFGCGTSKTNERSNSTAMKEKPMNRSNLQQIYVDAPPAAVKIVGRKATIRVSGLLPNPAYKLDHLAVNVRGKVIEVTPLAQHDPGKIVAQMLVPFTDSVEVEVPEAGEYTVRVSGRSQTVEAKFKVK